MISLIPADAFVQDDQLLYQVDYFLAGYFAAPYFANMKVMSSLFLGKLMDPYCGQYDHDDKLQLCIVHNCLI